MKNSNNYLSKVNIWELDEETRNSVKLAMWLIVDKDSPLKRAVKIAAKKHGAKQNKTEQVVKDALPNNFFSKRAKENMSPELKAIIRDKKIAEYNAKKML